jgi:hypothetical protein
MSIFAKGYPEDYLQHIITILHLINQKGLDVQCKLLIKEEEVSFSGTKKP